MSVPGASCEGNRVEPLTGAERAKLLRLRRQVNEKERDNKF